MLTVVTKASKKEILLEDVAYNTTIFIKDQDTIVGMIVEHNNKWYCAIDGLLEVKLLYSSREELIVNMREKEYEFVITE